jgi:hypothetical protein
MAPKQNLLVVVPGNANLLGKVYNEHAPAGMK